METAVQAVPWQPWQWKTTEGFWLRGVHTQPRGLPVIHFIHGNSYCGRIYEPMWEYLYPHFDLFLHDIQGHGDSDVGGRFVGWQRSAELAQEVWLAHRKLWPNVAHIGMGHSFGGVLTSVLGATNPDLFKRMWLLDPILMPPRYLRWVEPLQRMGLYKLNPYSGRARKRRAHWPDQASAYAGLVGRGMFKGWSTEAMHAYIEHGMERVEDGIQLKCPPSREAEIFGSYLPGLWKLLPQLDVPTDILFGQDSYPFLQESKQRLLDIKQVSMETVLGGHCFMLEHPKQTAQRLVQHCAEFGIA